MYSLLATARARLNRHSLMCADHLSLPCATPSVRNVSPTARTRMSERCIETAAASAACLTVAYSSRIEPSGKRREYCWPHGDDNLRLTKPAVA